MLACQRRNSPVQGVANECIDRRLRRTDCDLGLGSARLALFRSKGPLGGRVQGTARPENAVKIDDAVVAWS